MPRAIALVAVIAALLAPAAASAATRFATPGGGTVPGCPQPTPCSLEYAITAAAPGDEVVVGPGEYTLAATIETETPLWIHGQPGPAKPRIVAAGQSVFKSFVPQRLSDLELESTDTGDGVLFVPAGGTVVERLKLFSRGTEALGFRAGTTFTMTDTLIVAEAPANAVGVFIQGASPGAAQLRNDTIVAKGGEAIAFGVFMVAKDSSLSVAATNTIASGDQFDASARKSSEATGSTLSVSFDHSNLDTTDGEVTSTNGQTAPPLFAAGGFEPAPGSPTINFGINNAANGPTDLNGNPRTLPALLTCAKPAFAITDIGAYEFVPPAVTCVPQTKIVKLKKRGRKAKLRFTATGTQEAVTFKCRLDKRRWRRCASPKVYKRLKPGRHVFKVRAFTSAAEDPSPAKRKFRIKPPAKSKAGARR
ncbi:MAG TPA: hypothetical protein VNC16_09050 [Solirubrobacterales bacterium]|jgi:hypothetical protein|nr:hypothetical protein [Solirubrobacterales bacterium]